MRIKITHDEASSLIADYCYEEPPEGAVDRIIAIDIDSLVENDWIEIVDGLGMKKSEFDKILEPST